MHSCLSIGCRLTKFLLVIALISCQIISLQAVAARPSDETLQMFEPLELVVPLPGGTPTSPSFNVTSTYVDLMPPTGATMRHAVFYTQPFTRTQNADGSEVLVASGVPHYAVRLTCAALGQHMYAQRAAPGSVLPPGAITGTFECTAPVSSGDGWAAVDAVHKQYFVLRNVSGTNAIKPFWLVGENVAWPGVWPYFNGSSRYSNGTGGTYMYDRMLPRLAAVGGNYIRMWACPSLTEEPSYDGEQGSFLDLGLGALVPYGSYNLEAAWRIDYIVELCRTLGIKINLVIFTTQETCEDGGTWCFWNQATWNSANGGPLLNASDLWTNTVAREELEQRWRYVVARWAYATSIFSWELANENDGAAGWGDSAADLQLALASVIIDADPYGHLVDNSFLGFNDRKNTPVSRMEDDPRIAFTAAHGYGDGDFAAAVWGMVTPRVAAHGKPAFLQEHGASWKGPLQHTLDSTGIGSHNAAWASAVGIGAGTGMSWWWNEVDTLNTYGRLQGAATFVNDAIGDRLLAYTWSTWNNQSSSTGCAGSNAGWTIGKDEAGVVRAVSFFAYNRNHTWEAQNRSAELNPINNCTIVLHALSLLADVPPSITWYDTETGKPSAATTTERLHANGDGDGDLIFNAPDFITDVAALALME